MELVLALLLLHALEAVAKIVAVAVEKALLLDEVDEHQPVEHQRGVPLPVGHGLDALDELQEGIVLRLEAVVEPLGDPVHVEGGAQPGRHVDDGEVVFLIQREGDAPSFWISASPVWPAVIDMLPRAVRSPGFAFDPLPDLGGLVRCRCR